MAKEKIVSIEDRIPKLKQARKKKANRRLIFYLSIFFFLIAIIVYLQTPLSHIKSIDVEGAVFLTDQEVKEQSNIEVGNNIWMVPMEETKQVLEKHPIVQNVEVERKLPWTVKININEHKHVAYIHNEDGYYPILSNGTIVSTHNAAASGDAPIMVNFTDDEYLNRMAEELELLPAAINSLISEIHWAPSEKGKNKVYLYMTDGYVVNSTIRDFANKMKVYPSIVSQLEPTKEGMIHIGVGAYFESFDDEETIDGEEQAAE